MLLFVIEVNVVIGDVRQVFRSEVELRRVDLLAFGTLRRKVEVDRQIAGRVIAREFDAVLLAEAVVERRQDDRRSELTLVDEIDRLLVIRIESQRQRAPEFLLDADVVIVGSLRERRGGLRRQGWRRRVLEQGNVFAAYEFEGRRGEVAGIASMHGGVG